MSMNLGPRLQLPLRRSGLTLVEVLMSLMVTGIGILGVVALLPLAYVRAIQATNLTNATILRFNAESTVKLNTTNFEYFTRSGRRTRITLPARTSSRIRPRMATIITFKARPRARLAEQTTEPGCSEGILPTAR